MGDQRSVTGRTSQVLRDYRLKPKKSLGQNFLTDSRVLDKMVRAADIDKETGVLEVGPGIGSLTERLANVAGKVVAVEIDKRLIPILENTFASYDHVQIVCGDILALDVPKVLKEHLSSCKRTTVVANLPYYITSAVIMKLLELNWSFYRLVLMMQKEVAERVLAKPGAKITECSVSPFNITPPPRKSPAYRPMCLSPVRMWILPSCPSRPTRRHLHSLQTESCFLQWSSQVSKRGAKRWPTTLTPTFLRTGINRK